MFWKKKHPTPSPQDRARRGLLGDYTLREAAAVAHLQSLYEEPWRSYVRAQELLEAGYHSDALHLLEQLTPKPQLASRESQLYHCLRELGSQVSIPLRLLGVVVESSHNARAYDLLGTYIDRRAQFYPHTGGCAQWERPNASLDEAIGIVITMGEVLLYNTPLWQGATLSPLQGDALRITLISSRGFYVLEDSHKQLLQSMIVDQLYTAAGKLMQMMRSLM